MFEHFKLGLARIRRNLCEISGLRDPLRSSRPAYGPTTVSGDMRRQHRDSEHTSFSSDQGSQTGLGLNSTRLSDRPGTLSAVVSTSTTGIAFLLLWP